MSGARKIAVLGAGRMGAAMAGTLHRAGLEVVVYNRSRDKAERVADEIGVTVAATAAAAAASADIVVSSLADDEAVKETYTAPEGAAAGLRAGTIVMETSTIDPATLEVIEPPITAAGAHLLDSPVSGSVMLVEQGNLTFMVGGEAAAVEQARPVLDALGAQTFHVGGRGAGATMKLAVNAIVHGLNTALAEALVLAESAGVDRRAAYEVFANSAAAAPFVQYKRAAYEDPESSPVAFSLDLVAKDLDLILGLAAEVGVTMDQGAANRDVTAKALAAGLGAQDMSALAIYLRDG